MKVLLTHGYFVEEDLREQAIMKPYPPLGLLYISSYLTKAGVENEVFDSTFSTLEKLKEYVLEHKPPSIALYVNLMTKINVIKIMKWIKDHSQLSKTNVICGGPDVTYNVENYLKAGADYVVIGEGEQTMAELITTLGIPMNPFFDHIQGIAYQNALGEVHQTTPRQKLKELSQLQWPARNKIDMSLYLNAWKERHGANAISISTQRGCPYTCNWCSTAVYGQSYRRRPVADVVSEMKFLREEYHPDTLWFVDDVFTVSHKWLQEFQQELELQEVNIPFECITRADRLNHDVLDTLKAAGCYRVWIGAESGSQKIIDNMDRRVDVGVVRDMIVAAREKGMEAGTFIMVGYPGETIEDLKLTIEHLVISKPSQYTVTIAYPIKGTTLYSQVESKIIDFPDWEVSTDRDLDFKRTHSRKFYDHAVRWMYNEVEASRTSSLFLKFKFKVKSSLAQLSMRMAR